VKGTLRVASSKAAASPVMPPPMTITDMKQVASFQLPASS
jgi:hypothetical protein